MTPARPRLVAAAPRCTECGHELARDGSCPSCADRERAYADAEHDGREAPGPSHGFVLTAAAAIFEPLPPPAYLVEGALRRASLVLLGAYGSSGKTWIACDLAIAVGSGGQWLGRFPCKRGRAVFLDAESGDYELRRRLQAVARARNLLGAALQLEICVFPDVYLTSPTFEERIGRLAAECDLVIIDSLAAMSPGIDENSAEMRVGLDKLRRVAEASGCVFVVLLHAKKTSGNPDEIDPREIFRGSSAIFDAADAALAVIRKGDRLRVQQPKARHGKALDPFDLTIADVNGGVAVVARDETPAKQLSPFEAACEAVLDVVRAKPGCNVRHVRGLVTGRAATVGAAIDHLLEAGRLVNLGSEKAPQLRVREGRS